MSAQNTIIATYIPSGDAFEGAARAAETASAIVFRDGINRILTGEEPGAETVVVAAEAWRRSDTEALIGAQAALGRATWVEVTEASQVQPAIAAGAQGIIACGLEGGGLVADASSLVLLRLVLPLAGALPVLVRGGVGPDTAAGVVAAGASGVVLDTQLWLASDMPVDGNIQALLSGFNPLDTVTFGPGLGFRFRTFGQVATRPVRELRKLEGAEMTGEALYAEVERRLAAQPAQADPKRELLPLGQDAGLAVVFAERFGDVASMVAGLRSGVAERLAAAAADYPFSEGKGICRTNQTRLPFHQGPMAQVADVPEFAQAIAQSGSMAWLALANMPTSVATELVDDTAALLGDLPWGAGIIGLDANRYRDEHFAMLKEKKPPFVLVAAGTVEQALDFERADVATWLHTPTPGLLRMALESGLTRFILEGTEAGGHVGPLGSLALWQYGVLEIERAIAAGVDPQVLAMVPAGGLGDGPSSRAAAAILIGLHGQGVAVGLQMGTSYLMTSEAVATGAVSPTYQSVIDEAGDTLLMGESVSAPTRVLPTPHAHVTFATELDRRAQGVALKERKVAYEHDNLGGLRAAAKQQKIERVDPEKGAIFATISETEQRDTGLFHAGQTAAILGEVTDLNTYHERLLSAWSQPLAAPRPAPVANLVAPATASRPESTPSTAANGDDIVIVGIGALLPDASDKEAFWQNLLAGHCSIREVRPEDRWDPALHWSADRSATDRSYAKIGAFVDDFVPDRKAFRIPPKVLKSIDRVQLFALETARQALEDAGGFDESFPRETCAVMIGASQGGDLRLETTFRTEFPVVDKVLTDSLEEEGVDAATAKKIRERFESSYLAGKTPITEDSMAGELPNCIAGRVAGTFDLGGANWSVDAACASSLAALNVAVQSLRAGAHDAVVVGGVDSCMSPEPYVKFSKIGALSDKWSRPFDAAANGFVMGEGGGMLVIMRRADAEAQGRKIYAVVRGVGASSDGRGKGITAPNPKGQRRAVRRAYEDAKVDPKTVTYFEAHGTGTPVGDPVEVGSLIDVVGRTTHGASIGSVKSNIGHLKAAAGAAALVKTAMALHHKTLPPTLGVTHPNPKLPLEDGNIRLQLERSEWTVPEGVARRAGISAFGFGGTNVHVVLEEEGAWTSPGSEIDSMDAKTPKTSAPVAMAASPVAPQPVASAPAPAATDASATSSAPAAGSGVSQEVAYGTVVKVLCERTGYESDEIEPEFELEADLGIDTVKQAEIMAEVREVYALEKDADFRLADYPTLQDLARYVVERSALQGGHVVAAPAPSAPAPASTPKAPETPAAAPAAQGEGSAWDRLDGLLALGAESTTELRTALDGLMSALAANGLDAVTPHRATPSVVARPVRLAVAFEPSAGVEPLAELLKKTSAALEKGKGMKILANKGVYFSDQPPTGAGGLAFLFPGQGTQYLGMGRDLMERFPEAAEVFTEADRVMEGDIERPLSSFMHPGALADDAAKKHAFKELTRTEITQPAVLTMDAAVLAILRSLGYRADMVVGHSLGEYGACVAAGVMPFEGALKTVAARGAAMANVRPMNDDNGWMLAVSASAERVEAELEGLDGYIVCANKNCHAQTVTGGETETSKRALEKLTAAGLDAQRIPVSHAFHTKIIAPATEALLVQLATIDVNAPEIPILSNVTAKPYPTDPDQIRDLLARQVASPVEYIEQIEAMYEAGIRTFVEVGPKKAQVGFVSNILEGRDHRAIPTNHPKFGGLPSLRMAIGQLLAAGQAVEAYEAPAAQPPVARPASPAPVSAPRATGRDITWPVKSDVVCTGTAIGLPGLQDAFDESGFETLLTGRSLIDSMPQRHREAMASKKITRLMKGADGTADFVSIDSVDEVLKLSGQIGDFDLARDYGVEDRVVAGLDRASQLAFAAGLEALKDAHIPLVPRYRTTRSGKKVTIGVALPESMRDETGVIFASAFTGYDVAIDEATRAATDPEYSFDGRYVLKLIGMGHARFAEQIGARGPNTRVNAACASTTQAISIGEDWIRLGRCKRVIIIGGDDVTDDNLMPWVGGGFLATGAATQEADLEQAALPFDKRRNGTILGSGAVALILESPEVAERRGVVPLADLVGTRMANSAFHATRLDVDHIAGEVQSLIGSVEDRFQADRKDMSAKAVFVSHETFTPARGGSAAAEVESLRSAFGDGMDDIVIANIKGYTGHPMGAGLEDALAVRMLHKRRVPPIPHLEERDESLGNLTFSDGSEMELDYAIRLAAGFGSQLALGVWRRRALSDDRLDQARFDAWLREDVGLENAKVTVESRVLKARGQAAPEKASAEVSTSATVPAAAPAAAPSTSVPTSEEAYGRIVQVLCERTGYDADEVEPQFELEADLGIDTVKQAEIMAEVREVYALEKDADFRLADYPTIQDLARYVIERASLTGGAAAQEAPVAAPTPAAEPASVSAPATPSAEEGDVTLESAYGAIVTILCERTGYDAEEVEPQFELEADLGIDTVKQAEIMAEVREVYALEKDADFRLADYPTIQDLARYVVERREAQSSAPSAPSSTASQADEKASTATPEPPKEVVAAQKAPEAPQAASATAPATPSAPVASTAPAEVPFLARPVVMRQVGAAQADVSAAGTRVQGKTVAIIGGTDAEIAPLESALERLGARVVHLTAGDDDLLMDEVALSRKLSGITQLAGMINLLGLETLPPLEKPAEFALHQARRTFHVARSWVQTLDGAPTHDHFFVSLTSLGGALGHDDQGTTDGTRALVSGSVAGLTKTLSHEWSEATVRVVDLPEAMSATDPLVILGEGLSRGGYREIGLQDGKVFVAETADVEHTPTEHNLGVDTRWLITGGGRGITAVVALDLAARFPGGSFVLTGRTALTHEDPTSIDLEVERARIKAAMKEAGDKVTPVAIARALKPFEAQKEIAETLAALQAAGAQSRYVAFDVSDAASTRKALGEIGHVDVVVHGAGLEDSHFLMDKDTAVFDRVFITKVSGLIHLLDALTVNPSAVVAFTSVAGRYGNAGQVDYAAANDALARMLAARSRAGDFQGIATDWGPWADVGMATRGSIQTVLESSGVAMMPPELGAPMVGDLLASGLTGEVVCSGALGALSASPDASDAQAPLFQELERDYDGVIGTLALDAANMAMLDDHRIDGTAVLPGVMGMELFAQAAKALDPNTRIVGYEDVVFERPVKAHDGKEVSVQVTARPAGDGRVSVVLESLRRLATGKEARTQHFTATVLTGTTLGAPQPFLLPTEDLASEGPQAETIYEVFFHERSYRVLDSVPFMGARGLVALGRTSDRDPAPGVAAAQLMSDPLAREAALQAAGVWSMSQDGRMRLPAAVGRVSLFGTAAPGEDIVIRVLPRNSDAEHLARYDAEVWTREGRLLQRLESLDMIDAGPLPEGTGIVPGAPRRVLRDFMDISDAEMALDRLGLPLERLVTMEDLAAFHRQKNVQRRGEWLSARLAAKRLAGDWLQARFGVRPPPDAMLVVKDEFGAPSLLLRDGWADRLTDGEMMNLSISHSDGVAVAAIPVDPEIRVGIDIERIAPRPDAFADTWLEAAEMALPILDASGGQANEDARITALWCLKEATTKALGLGFNLAVSEVVVKTIDEHGVADVGVYGQAADRLVQLGGSEVRAEVRVDPRFAIAESIVVVDGGLVQDNDDAALAAVAALLREKGFLIEGRLAEGDTTTGRSVN